MLGGHGGDVRAAGKLADQNPPLVADELWVHVLVGARRSGDGMDMHPPFVREGAVAHERLIGTEIDVGRFVDEARQLCQVFQVASAKQAVAHFEAEIRHHGN